LLADNDMKVFCCKQWEPVLENPKEFPACRLRSSSRGVAQQS
jgi:hypothetical protein